MEIFSQVKAQNLCFLFSLFHTQKWVFCWIPVIFLLYHLSFSTTQVLFSSDVIKCWKPSQNQSVVSTKPYIFASRFTYERESARQQNYIVCVIEYLKVKNKSQFVLKFRLRINNENIYAFTDYSRRFIHWIPKQKLTWRGLPQ